MKYRIWDKQENRYLSADELDNVYLSHTGELYYHHEDGKLRLWVGHYLLVEGEEHKSDSKDGAITIKDLLHAAIERLSQEGIGITGQETISDLVARELELSNCYGLMCLNYECQCDRGNAIDCDETTVDQCVAAVCTPVTKQQMEVQSEE